jgi:predicted enzyme related to lactoylglutathione lyase
MPHIDKHAPGSFSWLELATTDQTAAKQFYSSLFGWEPADYPMGPNGVYTMFTIEGKAAGACFTIGAHEGHIPPHWQLYVSVASADDAAARAAQLGGKTIEGPFDVQTFGRMAVIQDPTGAFFSIWQAKTHIGTGITGVNGTLCWADLNTADPRTAKAFYENLFGWQFVPGKDKPADSYLHIKNGEDFIGGLPPAPERDQHARDPHTPPHWLLYFLVADCDASTEKAKELGAKIYMQPMNIDPTLRLSIVADPQGAVFALFTSQRS